jgi:hypothetical protein
MEATPSMLAVQLFVTSAISHNDTSLLSFQGQSKLQRMIPTSTLLHDIDISINNKRTSNDNDDDHSFLPSSQKQQQCRSFVQPFGAGATF